MNDSIWWKTPVVVLTSALAACSVQQPQASSPDAGVTFVKVDKSSLKTSVSGYAWDPEAYAFTMYSCSNCQQLAPVLGDAQPLFGRAVLEGAEVELLEGRGGSSEAKSAATIGDGIWRIPEITTDAELDRYTFVENAGQLSSGWPHDPPPGPALGPPPQGLPPTFVPVPEAGYLPTVTLRPIHAGGSACYAQEAAVASDSGVLEAVALQLTAEGTPTSVNDFVDASRYAFAGVFWFFQPNVINARLPAVGTAMESSAGRVFHLDWAEPGTGPDGLQSKRGFFVGEDPASSPIGAAVVLVPAHGAPNELTLSPVDTLTDASSRRPWVDAPITVKPVGGRIHVASRQFLRVSALDGKPEKQKLPDFACSRR